jgi:tetratricopeptide (TPR) repeat protein
LEPRFQMLETVREFALERLAASGEAETILRRYVGYFLTLVEQAEPELLAGPSQRRWFDRLAEEHDNLRAALAWTIEHDGEQALRLAAALGSFWYFRGFLVEGRSWLERALAVSDGSQARSRAEALSNACSLAWAQRDQAAAVAFGEEALALFRQLGDRRGEASALRALGAAEIAADRGDPDRPGDLLEQALAIWRELGIQQGLAATLGNLGFLAWTRGETTRAIERYEEALTISRAIGDQANAAVQLALLGMLAAGAGEFGRAKGRLDEALVLARELRDPRVAAHAAEGLAWVAAATAQPVTTARLLGAADALFAAAGSALSPPQRADHQRASDRARTTLGEAGFAAAWAAGGALSLDEVVAEALVLDLASAPLPSSQETA